ncbi:FAD-binding oxidoreductase [Humibacter sp. BT305]|nr:FAD-binding oxidoreductase [Humibacter sp. BT305]
MVDPLPIGGNRFLRGQIIRDLSAEVGPQNVRTDDGERQRAAADWSYASKLLTYSHEEQPAPDIVVLPRTTAEVAAVVRIASDFRIPLTTRGGGSGTQAGLFALYGGLTLDLSRMTDIVEIDEESLVVTAQAGLAGPALEEAVNERGLTLAHYPGSYNLGATVGGYLAARGSGVVSTKYGKAEEMAMQVTAVVPPGRVVSTLPVPNHASGPDLLQVFVGSEGTLGVITEASLRLDPLPESRRFLSFVFPDIFAGIEAGRRIMTSRLRPAVIRLYDTADSLKLQDWVGTTRTGNVMIVMCDGAQELVDYECRAISEIAAACEGQAAGSEMGEIWWRGKYEPYAKGKLPEPPLMYGTFDTVARFKDIPAIYRAKKAAIEGEFAQYGARYTCHLSHWFPWGSMLYDRFYVDDAPEDPAEAMWLHDRLWNVGVTLSIQHGGTINEHHGVGLKLGRFMRTQYGDAFQSLLDLKNAWDPDGIMNPGKLGFGPPRNSVW